MFCSLSIEPSYLKAYSVILVHFYLTKIGSECCVLPSILFPSVHQQFTFQQLACSPRNSPSFLHPAQFGVTHALSMAWCGIWTRIADGVVDIWTARWSLRWIWCDDCRENVLKWRRSLLRLFWNPTTTLEGHFAQIKDWIKCFFSLSRVALRSKLGVKTNSLWHFFFSKVRTPLPNSVRVSVYVCPRLSWVSSWWENIDGK